MQNTEPLVEIDLLRAWPALPMMADGLASDYRILVRRGEQGHQAALYAFNLRDRIPTFALPLQEGDVEPVIDSMRTRRGRIVGDWLMVGG